MALQALKMALYGSEQFFAQTGKFPAAIRASRARRQRSGFVADGESRQRAGAKPPVPTERHRRLIHTTNAVDAVHSMMRRATKTKAAFPNEEAALKLLFLRLRKLEAKSNKPLPRWAEILNYIALSHHERVQPYIRLSRLHKILDTLRKCRVTDQFLSR